MATGDLQGRWAFGIQTGLGKTTCTIAWLAALAKLGFAGRVTVAVASTEAEALCEIMDALKDLQVDMGLCAAPPRRKGAISRNTSGHRQADSLALSCASTNEVS